MDRSTPEQRVDNNNKRRPKQHEGKLNLNAGDTETGIEDPHGRQHYIPILGVEPTISVRANINSRSQGRFVYWFSDLFPWVLVKKAKSDEWAAYLKPTIGYP